MQALKEGLEHAPESVSPRELAAQVASSVQSSSQQTIEAVIRTLKAFHSVRNDAGVGLEEFSDDVADSLRESEVLRDEDTTRLVSNLRDLMQIENFALSMKAYNLERTSERLYCKARIVTDLRPMFGDEPSEGPKGFVILHNLRIGYHESDKRHKNFYLTLDSVDLLRLRSVIDRALEKSDSLKEHVTSLPYFGIS